MKLVPLITLARDQAASDLHLEPGLPAAIRVRGALRTFGEPLTPRFLFECAQEIIASDLWPHFVEQRSYDGSLTLNGVRCRINIFQTARGTAFAVRLLATFQASIEKLNLHPDLKRFTDHANGLIIVTGSTGSGKSSTLAALVHEVNMNEAKHIITIESPIEYAFRPRKAYIRQREVGRDTPTFERGLLDALREDPDILMVGEMRDPETMRLTLNASETGHLVLATMHSATCAEALHRLVAAFPSDIQSNVAAQLADCLVGVVAQRLRFRPELNIRVPELEILLPTTAVKSFIRTRDFFKIASALEIGSEHGMWSFQRYQAWTDKKANWFIPDRSQEAPDSEPPIESTTPLPPGSPSSRPAVASRSVPTPGPTPARPDGRIEIDPTEEFEKILRK